MKLPIPPSCLVTILATCERDTVDLLNFVVPLIGINSEAKDICINRSLQREQSGSKTLFIFNHSDYLCCNFIAVSVQCIIGNGEATGTNRTGINIYIIIIDSSQPLLYA